MSRLEGLWRQPPTWLLGAVVALLSWNVGIFPPSAGLDASWSAGLAMATQNGLQYGIQLVFSYGPLGFLQGQRLWYSDLGVLAFLFSAALHIAFCIGLVWALRRRLPALPAVAIAFLAVAVLPTLEQALLLAVLVSLAILERERSPRTINLFVVAAAGFAAVEALLKLSTGPVIAVIFLLALIGARASRLQIALFAALFAAELTGLWLLSGQSLGAVPDFVEATLQIIGGYSTAMLRKVDVPAWKVTLATVAAAAITVAVVVASYGARFRDQRARLAGAGLVALAAFTLFKEGVVRTDAGHLSLYFSSACVLWIAIPWAGRRWLLAGAAAIALMGIPVRPPGLSTNLDPVANVRLAGEGVHALVSGARRADLLDTGRTAMRSLYRLDRPTRSALEGRTVAVEPWEAGVAWAYELDWNPLPVFQNYSAYTSELDRLNAAAAESQNGPERILRENQLLVLPEFPTPDLDGRYPGWDPPEQARAVLCNFAPLHTTERWQVLGRVPDRCGRPRPIGSVESRYGEVVEVPPPGPGEVVFARIHGAGVGGLERLTALILHARVRQVVVNGSQTYRLLPETAGDGLLLRADPRLTAAEGPVFTQVPQAETIRLEGASGGLKVEFFAMAVRPVSAGPS
ncbi:MAG: hypothetical protein QOF23_1071 [Solirubrobacterales bacterium]|nr:hypothetical protein [Solirubrobacterales bacterium]